ncbi:MAG TPA: AbrB/MazE/SpoVT family DNA-binding domain-containing protein [Acetobacteraceae bacterium]|nr:AbrB/MazE/SpoVT family DNA-binding domain-containing protein [Acetobacteraceae bacterium]
MQVRVSRWGNSVGLRIPKELAEQFGLVDGTQIEMRAERDGLMLSPARPRFRLEDLLEGMTPETMHEAFDWGPDVGRERAD